MKKMNITIGIPAFNEEKNIEQLLLSVLSQKQNTITIEEIIIYSDASTDKTRQKVEELQQKYQQIRLIKGTERKGKYYRVNQLFKLCRNDVIIILDADIGLVGENFLEDLVSVIRQDPKALLVASHQIQLRPKTFIGKMIYANFLLWDYVRWSIPEYHSARNYYGSATAYKGNFARSINIPIEVTDPHLYLYLMADSQGGFRYASKAKMVQWPIATFADYNKLLRRSIGQRDSTLLKLFGEKYIHEARFVHRKYKLQGLRKAILHEPIFVPLSFLLILYRKIAPFIQTDKTAQWDIAGSTKNTTINNNL